MTQHRRMGIVEKGVAASGSDNGAAGPRADYGTSYFAAFLLDPVGNDVEAVCNKEGA
jgi:hypothetical protein